MVWIETALADSVGTIGHHLSREEGEESGGGGGGSEGEERVESSQHNIEQQTQTDLNANKD